jgi:acetylornithine deacetylase/succinyl-diaminopimelate desuccinylase-like protein
MTDQFHRIIEDFRSVSHKITVSSIGVRPCGMEVPEEKQQKLIARCSNAVEAVCGCTPVLCSGSTDANIPLSLGIPAVTFGLYQGGGAHTRQEYVDIKSLTTGLKIALTFLLDNNIVNENNVI